MTNRFCVLIKYNLIIVLYFEIDFFSNTQYVCITPFRSISFSTLDMSTLDFVQVILIVFCLNNKKIIKYLKKNIYLPI